MRQCVFGVSPLYSVITGGCIVSMMLMVKAIGLVGNPLRKLVLLKLADNASDQGECWPSYQYIADQCEWQAVSHESH
jgi:hypothetical protein